MEKPISAAEANRKFSQLLREVREGRSYVVTSHGRPVARIAPVQTKSAGSTAARARNSLLARLRRQPAIKIGRWKREELYD
jgi:prevent-host-death family protein